MLKTVIIADNPLDVLSYKRYEVDNVFAFIESKYPEWPETARLYHSNVSIDCDVTPSTEEDITRLMSMSGPFYVIVYPGDPIWWVVGILAVSVIASMAVALTASVPNVASRNYQQASPNNQLSDRKNEARPLARIPDVFGTVRSTPDLLSVPYRAFINHEEVEYCFMCIGRGSYDVSDIRDGATLCSDIAGTSVEVYAPMTCPNSGVPQLSIGTAINTPVYSVSRSNSVNGQVLRAANSQFIIANNNIWFSAPNQINTGVGSGFFDFSSKYASGDTIQMVNSGGLDGVFTISAVTTSSIMLENPSAVNAAWAAVGTTGFRSPLIASYGPIWLGPFVLDLKDMTKIFANFVALNGLYLDNGQNQYEYDVALEMEVTPINADGSARGAAVLFETALAGSAVSKATRAVTLNADLPFTGRCSVRVRRVTDAPTWFSGQVVDEIKLRDLYAVSEVGVSHFGDVTTVQSITLATAAALSVKERKLNMLVTRKISTPFTGNGTIASNNAADIISAICLDKFIGNRNENEVDFESVYNSVYSAIDYFGTSKAAEFNYTFDKADLSFEESISSIAAAVFCTAYRRGSQIKLSFERQTADSTLLFNHRNKLPGSETRTVSFGNDNDNDGVEYTYVDPVDDAVVSIYLPEDRSAINPLKIESIGIRSRLQAWFQAWRAWNKIRFQNVTVDFEATQEAGIIVLKDRVLIADNTRPDTQDGQVEEQNGLTLTLSQQVDLASYSSYSIFLQHVDGTVESIPITGTNNPFEVVLSRPPKMTLALDPALYANTTYVIVGNTETGQKPFLVVEKTPRSNFTVPMKAINYTDKYYQNDSDYINGVIDIDGNTI